MESIEKIEGHIQRTYNFLNEMGCLNNLNDREKRNVFDMIRMCATDSLMTAYDEIKHIIPDMYKASTRIESLTSPNLNK